jgi:nucleotidyltransferase substrate binding protein (TIGR01987 family)
VLTGFSVRTINPYERTDMSTQDIRWKQRFSNYRKALRQLEKAVELSCERPLTELEQQGLIQGFEMVHELAWNVLKDFFEYQGNSSIMGSRDATREAFKRNLIVDGDGWMEMIVSRNKSTHTYNEETAAEVARKVLTVYVGLFLELRSKLQELQDAE